MALKIVIENNIPFIRGLLDDMAKVEYMSPEQITADAMRDADALITRTRVHCDAALLDGSRCRMIASATIGLDHVDTEYCASHGIVVANAPGCNAPAVAQYVMASIIEIFGRNLSGVSLGIVGVGHVGQIVERWARGLGMNVLLCDPPRARKEKNAEFISLSEIAARADIITFHTPYTRVGIDATHHLFDKSLIGLLKRRPVIINSARGPIVDTASLKSALISGKVSEAVIDCWEYEPYIDKDLLAASRIATPHIAGYSVEGKQRATYMAVEAVVRYFGLVMPVMPFDIPGVAPDEVSIDDIVVSYSPENDTRTLKTNPENFELLRNKYVLRNEVKNVK